MGPPIYSTPSRRRRSRTLRAASPNNLSAEPLSVQLTIGADVRFGRQGGHKRPREAESFTDRNTSGITLSSRCRSEEAAQFVRSLLRNFLWKEMTGVERSAMDIVCPSPP